MDTPKYKQLLSKYNSLTDEKERIDTYIDMAVEMRNYDVDSAFEMADEILERAEKIHYLKGRGRGLNLKGYCYWQQGEYDLGLEELEKAYLIAKEVDDRKLEARVLNNFGNIYRDLGDLTSALNYYTTALEINEELGDDFAQAVNISNISNLHYDLNDYDSALEYALKCLPTFERAHDNSRLISIYNTLGNIYFKQEKFQEALRYFEENLNQSEPETLVYIMAESGLGKVYYKMHDFDNARKYLKDALEESEELANVEVQIISSFYLGRLHMDEGDYRDALKHLEMSYGLADEYSRRHDLMSIHEYLSALYDKMGDIPKAFHHLKAFEQLKEEIFKQTTVNKLKNLQIQQEIELARKEKEVAERTAYLKQQFMANMSHEIRTPMNAIVGMTRLLLAKDPKPEQLKYLGAIQMSADNLLVIINDILDLSKIEAGKIIIENVDFSLNEVVQSISDMLMVKAEEKGLEFRTHVDPAIPQRLLGDPTRINQVLINLAGNAVKFTEKGYINVCAKLLRSEGKKHWIELDVEDTGIGIASDYIEKIFESFTQAGTDVARKYGGTGLGLTISKQLISLMDGQLSVKSEFKKGTTFTAIIPLEEAESQEAPKENNIIDEKTLQRLNNSKILLVEDNEFNRMVAEDTLKELIPGARVDIAINGRDAVDRVQAGNYNIVLMDIQMPVMDGVAATKAIRSLPTPKKDIGIIAMTANVLQEDVHKYLAAGMNAYVSKPFQTNELLLKMGAVLENKPVEHIETAYAPKEQDEAPIPEHVTNMQFMRQFAGGNPEKMQKYIGMFLENAPRLLNNVHQALKNKDYESLKIAAHSLKPQLSYMGITEEVSHIFLLEQTAGEAYYEKLPGLVEHLDKVCDKAFEELKLVTQ